MQEAIEKAWEAQQVVAATGQSYELTKSELRWARFLRVAPWLAFFVVALPVPIALFVLSFFLADAAVFVLLALLALGGGAVAGLLATIFLLFYRNKWTKKIRQRLAADGVKTSELDWFKNELTSQERKALKAMDAQDPLMADAYRETLAMRLTATHVIKRTKQDLRQVEQRLNKLVYVKDADTSQLRTELTSDQTRFRQILLASTEHEAQAKIRLQTIEASVQRGANWADTSRALQRLSVSSNQLPLSLEMAKLEQDARAEAWEGMKDEG